MAIMTTPVTGSYGDNMVSVYVPIGEMLTGLFLGSAVCVVGFGKPPTETAP